MFTYYHNLNPIFLTIKDIKLHYYGLSYVIALLTIWFFLRKLFKENYFSESKIKSLNDIDTITLAIAIVTLISARLFYGLIYDFNLYYSNIGEIFAVWHGGMSILGGFIGAMIAVYVLSKIYDCNFFLISDGVLLFIPLLLVIGRITNFVNGELVGRIATGFPLCIDYSQNAYLIAHNILISGCRLPSQLFEAIKNLILFAILFYIYKKYYRQNFEYYNTASNRHQGLITIYFFLLYSLLRFIVEFSREADIQVGYFTYQGIAFTINQVIFGCLFVMMVLVLLWREYYFKKIHF